MFRYVHIHVSRDTCSVICSKYIVSKWIFFYLGYYMWYNSFQIHCIQVDLLVSGIHRQISLALFSSLTPCLCIQYLRYIQIYVNHTVYIFTCMNHTVCIHVNISNVICMHLRYIDRSCSHPSFFTHLSPYFNVSCSKKIWI